jgi:RNA polymerase sigma-70 factor (ECF subfamily)
MVDRGDSDRADAVWIGRVVRDDDHEAFAELVRRHQSAVRRFLRRLAGNDEGRADDLAQETFWKAYRHIGSFGFRGKFLSWLFRIAYQEFVSDERRRHGVSSVPLPADLEADGGARDQFIERRTFDQLMDLLRPEERAALVLHYRHDMTHAEISEVLALPLGTVKTLIRRGRIRLSALVADRTPEEDG